MKMLATIVLALACATPALTQDHLKLADGTRLVGAATAYDADTQVVTFITQSGETLQIAAADLDRLSAYKLAKTKVDKSSADDLIKLGDIARDLTLYAYAKRHYADALKVDKSLAGRVDPLRARLRTEAGQYCLNLAREARAKGDKKTAEKWLKTVVEKLPNEPEATQAAALLAELLPQSHAALDDDLEANHDELIKKELAGGIKHYNALLEGIRKGLTGARSERAAKTSFEGAWKSGEKAQRELDKVQKALSKDGVNVAELFDGYRALVTEHMVAAQLHLASRYATQSDYKSAQKAVNQALSIDPKNKEARAARARIEEAASRGWGWGWND